MSWIFWKLWELCFSVLQQSLHNFQQPNSVSKLNFWSILDEPLILITAFICGILRQRHSQVEVPSGSDLWSDRARQKYPLIRLKCARNTVCARNCLLSDLSRQKCPLIRPKPDHFPEDCALKVKSDQTIVRSKITPDQTIVRPKSPLIRLNCVRNSLISEWFSLWTNFFNFVKIFSLKKVVFALLNSSTEKNLLKVLLKKQKPKCWEKVYLLYH